MKIDKSEVRMDEGWLRAFITVEGIEYLLPVSKPLVLAQGVTQAPEEWPYPLEGREIFMELDNEDSASEGLVGITDPVIVGIAIRCMKQQAKDAEGAITLPSLDQAMAEIAALRKEIA